MIFANTVVPKMQGVPAAPSKFVLPFALAVAFVTVVFVVYEWSRA